jgi:DNA replication and repair protein RecF
VNLVPSAVATENIPHTLAQLRIQNFRCITAAELQFSARLNVFTGPNGAGKTSLLEALYCLGRARSFRTPDRGVLIRLGAREARLDGTMEGGAGRSDIGVRLGAAGIEIHLSGQPAAQVADLVSALPLQAIDADIGEIVRGSPANRRRLLDWGVFHVKHGYLSRWRRCQRALRQRNAALRANATAEVLTAWEMELAAAATEVDEARQDYVRDLAMRVAHIGEKLLGTKVGVRCLRGWPEGEDLAQLLKANREVDRQFGHTRCGPHRADLQLETPSQRPRWSASRGEQKLLGASLALAQCDLAASHLGRPIALLVDEPAAELDREHVDRLISTTLDQPVQVFMATITAERLPLHRDPAMFHVEHGVPKALL